MNTANLQLEGLCLAVAMVNAALVRKGVLTREEIDTALETAQTAASADRVDGMSHANHDAVSFPIRLLKHANSSEFEDSAPSFSELTRMVGGTPHAK